MVDKTSRVLHTLVSDETSSLLPLAKFHLGDRVCWFRVSTQDFGVVIDRFYGTEGSVQALGWHYTIQLDSSSPSFAHCKIDYGFEEDLALMDRDLGGADAVD
ncbi:MAG: hypothetical protein KME27_20745 [Lyngbya sp. HA4199-MV5]|nr:hypothetical protein [Lyngbya sp. HA4199-MV5]